MDYGFNIFIGFGFGFGFINPLKSKSVSVNPNPTTTTVDSLFSARLAPGRCIIFLFVNTRCAKIFCLNIHENSFDVVHSVYTSEPVPATSKKSVDAESQV